MRRRRTPVTEIIFSAAQFHKLSLAPGAETDPPLSCEELGIQDPLQFAGMSSLTMFQAENMEWGRGGPGTAGEWLDSIISHFSMKISPFPASPVP